MLELGDGFAAIDAGAAPAQPVVDLFECEGCHQMNIFLRREDARSIRLTVSTIRIRTAQVCAYWKPRITSHSITPMPPAPTMPTTVAERTFDSKRYSAYEIHSGITCGSTP